MSKRKERITDRLRKIGAIWAVRTDKFIDPNDPIEYQMARKATYHIHPNVTYPHQNDIKLFSSLEEIEEWLEELKNE